MFVLVVLALIIITLYYRGTGRRAIESVQRLVLTVVAPMQKVANSAIKPAKDASAFVFSFRHVTTQNRNLRKANFELRREVKQLRKFRIENKRLRKLAGFRRDSKLTTVAGRVIGRSPTSWQSLVTIDIGRNHGIAKNMPAITEKGLVGRVVQISRTAAVIQLLDDRRSGVGVEIKRSGATAVAEGALGENLRLRFLADDADIKVGDKIVTSGVGSIFPRGIPVGAVVKSTEIVYGIEKVVSVRPIVNLARLTEVLIITEQPSIESK